MRGDVQAPGAARGTGIAVKGHRRRRFRGGFRGRRRGRQRRPDQFQTARPAAVGQEAEVTDPHKAFGQHMQQEAPDQFLASQGHDLVATAVAVVLVADIHRLVVLIEVEQPPVRQGDAMAVAAQVLDHGVGARQTGLGIDHPLGLHQGVEDPLDLRRRNPGQAPLLEGPAQAADETAAEVPGQGPHREQVSARGRMPGPVGPEGPARHQTVQVDMAHQRLPPGMQHRRHPQLSVQALGVLTEGGQGRPHRLEQQGVDDLGVDLDPAVEGVGQGEDQVMVGDRQDRRALALDPVFAGLALAARAMAVTAGVIEKRAIPALVTLQGEAAQGGGATVQNVMTDLPLVRAQRVVFGITGQARCDDRLQGGISHGPPPIGQSDQERLRPHWHWAANGHSAGWSGCCGGPSGVAGAPPTTRPPVDGWHRRGAYADLGISAIIPRS